MLLANKFNTRASPEPDSTAWKRVLAEIEETLQTPSRLEAMSLAQFNRIVGNLWGAVTRGDRFLSKSLSEAISHAVAKCDRSRSHHVARGLHILFLPLDTLYAALPPAHVITKRLHKQWAYHHCVHGVLNLAHPPQPESDESVAYAIYVLHAARALSPAQYEADADKILRIALVVMHKAVEHSDIEAALAVTLDILAKDARLVGNHAASVMAACVHVYTKALVSSKHNASAEHQEPSSPWRSLPWGEISGGSVSGGSATARAELRERSVYLLLRLARDLDEPAARPRADEVIAHLETVLGDQLRHIRQLAQAAKGAWLKLR